MMITQKSVFDTMQNVLKTHVGYTIKAQAEQEANGGVAKKKDWFMTPQPALFAQQLATLGYSYYVAGKDEVIEVSVTPLIKQLRALLDGETISDEQRQNMVNLCDIVEQYTKGKEGA